MSNDDTDADEAEQRQFRDLFRRLRKDPTVLRCGTVYVDVPGAVERRVACGDGLCWKSAGASLTGKSCCTTFRVPVTRTEIRRIEHVLPEVRKVRDVGEAIDRAGRFWFVEDDRPWLSCRPDEACVFLSAPPGGMPLCTLHEWAFSKGLDHRRVKPETCSLFPLYLVQWGDDAFVTGYGSPWFCELEPGERDDVRTFACTAPPPGVGLPLVVEQSAELAYRLGTRRWSAVMAKLRAAGHLPAAAGR